jgi:hypothetical protein
MKNNNLGDYFIKGHLNEDALALFADALVLKKEDSLPAAIRNHVEECQQCKIEVFGLYEIMKNDNVIQNTENHPYFNSQIVERKKTFQLYNLLKIVALILLVISVGSLIHNLLIVKKNNNVLKNNVAHNSDRINNNVIYNNNKEEKKVKKDSLKHSSTDNLTALNLEESALFENLIASHYRGSDIEVNTPRLKQKFNVGQPIVFEINGDLSNPVIINIYSNKGNKIIERNDISTNTFTIDNELPPGLYYWKLLQEDNLVQVGKFFVK